MWMSHGTHMKEPQHTYEWVMAHAWISHGIQSLYDCHEIITLGRVTNSNPLPTHTKKKGCAGVWVCAVHISEDWLASQARSLNCLDRSPAYLRPSNVQPLLYFFSKATSGWQVLTISEVIMFQNRRDLQRCAQSLHHTSKWALLQENIRRCARKCNAEKNFITISLEYRNSVLDFFMWAHTTHNKMVFWNLDIFLSYLPAFSSHHPPLPTRRLSVAGIKRKNTTEL